MRIIPGKNIGYESKHQSIFIPTYKTHQESMKLEMFLLLSLSLSLSLLPFRAAGFSRPFATSDDYCSNGPNRYFCSTDCQSYYYCNGQKKGQVLQCPQGTVCNKLGPHKKHFDSDEAGATKTLYDSWDVTYACEPVLTATASCWKSRTPGLCENSGNQDQTCSGGGSCRSTSPDCASNPLSRSCFWDNAAPENCQCFTAKSSPPTSFDPTFTSNITKKQSEGVSCSIINPGK
jgi:hypothetical protein